MAYYTVREVAELLRVSSQTIYRWIEEGRIEAVRVGPKVFRIPKDSLDTAIRNATEPVDN